MREAIDFGKKVNADGYLAVGGGSVMDTTKMINLYGCYPEADLMDFVTPSHSHNQTHPLLFF